MMTGHPRQSGQPVHEDQADRLSASRIIPLGKWRRVTGHGLFLPYVSGAGQAARGNEVPRLRSGAAEQARRETKREEKTRRQRLWSASPPTIHPRASDRTQASLSSRAWHLPIREEFIAIGCGLSNGLAALLSGHIGDQGPASFRISLFAQRASQIAVAKVNMGQNVRSSKRALPGST